MFARRNLYVFAGSNARQDRLTVTASILRNVMQITTGNEDELSESLQTEGGGTSNAYTEV